MCCLFGLMDCQHRLTAKQKNRILSTLSVAAEARGTDATGIAYNSVGKLHVYKRPLPAHRMRFRVPEDACVIMGHTRMTTQGAARKNRNNHPFSGKAGTTDFALAHNGVLWNDGYLRRSRDLPATRIETDSYVAVQLLERKKALDLASLKWMAEQVEGSFSFTVLDDADHLHIVRGNNPFCLYHHPNLGLYIYASTEDILKQALSRLWLSEKQFTRVELDCGDILQISSDGTMNRGHFDCSALLGWEESPWLFSSCRHRGSGTQETDLYLEELRAVAPSFGYVPEAVDRLSARGFTPEDIDEFFYCGCFSEVGGEL